MPLHGYGASRAAAPSATALRRLAIEAGWEPSPAARVRHRHPETVRVLGRLLATGLRATGLWRRAVQNASRLTVRHVQLALPRWPSSLAGLRILHLSDLHADLPLPLVPRVIECLRGLAVDVCVVTGDYRYKSTGPIDRACDAVAKILAAVNAPLGTFGVLGNHDTAAMVPRLAQCGLTMLLNTSIALGTGGGQVHVLGVDDPHYFQCDDLSAAAAGVPADSCKILLAHSPELAQAAAVAGIDLYLCGHTHGGQICLPGIGPLWVNARCPRRLTRGLWRFGDMAGVTNAGIGCSLVPARLNCPPEVLVLELAPSR